MSERQRRIEEAAFLRATGRKIGHIHEVLQVSPATVIKLLQDAEGQGLYCETASFNERLVDRKRLRELKLLDYVDRLGSVLRQSSPLVTGEQRIFRQIHVFDSGSFDHADRSIASRLAVFGRNAGDFVSEIVASSKVTGVAWGTTLSSVIGSITPPANRKRRIRVRVIPTCGEPFGTTSRAYSSSQIAAKLHEVINGPDVENTSLSGVPVVIPKQFADKGETDVIKRLLWCSPSYCEIFGAPHYRTRPVVEQLDTILTSVNPVGRPWRMCGVELCEIGGFERSLFEATVLGDIGGVLLPKQEYMKPEAEVELTRMRDLWTGIKLSDYKRVARQAGKQPGVVVFAIDANKAKVVFRAIKLGLVNHLVCDSALAQALCKECGAPGPSELTVSSKKRKPSKSKFV